MSELKVNSIKGVAASAAAITVNNTDGTCTAKITNNLSNKNLIINGACNVTQYGTSSTTESSYTVDRFKVVWSGLDESLTYTQHALTSSDTGPWAKGFRNSLHVQNGNQTSGAGAADRAAINYSFEAQDIANSGWDYTSASSYVTLSFWVKSSVAQTFYFSIRTDDGTGYNYPIETGSLTADTWTKVTKTIPGNSNLTVNNDNGLGLIIEMVLFRGTDSTGTVTLNQWATYSGSTRTPDNTSTWYTTNDSTFEITGLQLEVGDVATDFEHRSYGDELARCQRYYYLLASGNTQFMCMGDFWTADQTDAGIQYPVEMRATPTLDHTNGADYYIVWTNSTSSYIDGTVNLWNRTTNKAATWYATADTSRTAGHTCRWTTSSASAHFAFTAEL